MRPNFKLKNLWQEGERCSEFLIEKNRALETWPRGDSQTLDRSCEQRRLPQRETATTSLFMESVTLQFCLAMFLRYGFAAKQSCWISACHFTDEYELLTTLTKNFNWIVQYIHFQNRKQLKGDDDNYINLKTTYNILWFLKHIRNNIFKTFEESFIKIIEKRDTYWTSVMKRFMSRCHQITYFTLHEDSGFGEDIMPNFKQALKF